MKKLKIAFSFLLIIVLFSAFAPISSAAETGQIIYNNDFENGKLDDTFEINYGSLNVVDEKGERFLRCSHENNRLQFAYGPTEQRDVDISFRLRATTFTNASTATVSPFFRSPHIPAWDTVSYQVQFKTYQTSLIYADRFADDATLETMVDYLDFGISLGLWNNVQISTRGDRIIVYVNGDRILETVDSRYGQYGGFGFAGLYSSFDIDDIVITRYYGETLPEPVANERPLWMGDASEKEEADVADTGVIRIDLTTLGQEKVPVDRAINYTDPTQVSVFTVIAIITAVACAALSCIGMIKLKKFKGGEHQ